MTVPKDFITNNVIVINKTPSTLDPEGEFTSDYVSLIIGANGRGDTYALDNEDVEEIIAIIMARNPDRGTQCGVIGQDGKRRTPSRKSTKPDAPKPENYTPGTTDDGYMIPPDDEPKPPSK